ncbi:membrane protein insertion efficiency factor YidD [Candidatus Gracilibacteria bacterium]|nr:membrane protein insertion efficiency factor YidD [Candidatus Gracilibacteria bacterium]
MRRLFLYIWKLPRNTAAFFVVIYQKTLSPDHGWFKPLFPYGYCRFKPSCSEYARQSLKKHGLVWGSLKAGWRILRCNPWSKGGVDEVGHLKLDTSHYLQ